MTLFCRMMDHNATIFPKNISPDGRCVLAARPDVLLIDELGAGLSSRELEHVASLLREIKDAGVALIVVEHLMDFLEQIVDSVVVMDAGVQIFRGTLRDAVADRRVIETYLGGSQ
jgi:branched-chain amino acid transport system ATP-binding protein